MRPQIIGIAVVMLVVGLGTFLFLNQNPAPPSQTSSETQEKSAATDNLVIDDTQPVASVQSIGGQKNSAPSSAGSYQPYSKAIYDNSAGKTRILYFYATWCPKCITANAEFEARIREIPADVVILRVNYNDPDTDDEEKALARKYAITYQHVFVQVDSQGNEITKWHGGALDKLLLSIKK